MSRNIKCNIKMAVKFINFKEKSITVLRTNKFAGMHKFIFRMYFLKIITRETSMKGKKSVTSIKWNAHM